MSSFYTSEFKEQAVALYRKSNTTYAAVAKELGIDPGSLSSWVKKADEAAAGAGTNTFKLEEENRKLKRKNARLKEENEILLKASAFFATKMD